MIAVILVPLVYYAIMMTVLRNLYIKEIDDRLPKAIAAWEADKKYREERKKRETELGLWMLDSYRARRPTLEWPSLWITAAAWPMLLAEFAFKHSVMRPTPGQLKAQRDQEYEKALAIIAEELPPAQVRIDADGRRIPMELPPPRDTSWVKYENTRHR